LQTSVTKSQVAENKGTHHSQQDALTPQSTPESLNTPETDIPGLPSDLAEIVAVWPRLPEHIRAAIMALVRTQGRARER
jgi:hypothetical protein